MVVAQNVLSLRAGFGGVFGLICGDRYLIYSRDTIIMQSRYHTRSAGKTANVCVCITFVVYVMNEWTYLTQSMR